MPNTKLHLIDGSDIILNEVIPITAMINKINIITHHLITPINGSDTFVGMPDNLNEVIPLTAMINKINIITHH